MKHTPGINFSSVDEMPNPNRAITEMDTVRAQGGIQELKRIALSYFNPQPGERLLDIGCGSGEDVRHLAKLVGPGGYVLGIDSSVSMIEEARRRTSSDVDHVEFRVAEAAHLDCENESVDGCWSERTLQHIEQPEQVISEIRRVLRPDGRLILIDTDWDTFVINSSCRKLAGKVAAIFADGIANPGSGRRLLPLCRRLGFHTITAFSSVIQSDNLQLLNDGLDFEAFLSESVRAGMIPDEEREEFRADLYSLNDQGEFFFSVTVFGIAAAK